MSNNQGTSHMQADLSKRHCENAEKNSRDPEDKLTLALIPIIDEYNTMKYQQKQTALEISELQMERSTLRNQSITLKGIVSRLSKLNKDQKKHIQSQQKHLDTFRHDFQNTLQEFSNTKENTKHLETIVEEVKNMYLAERNHRLELEETLESITTNGDSINTSKQEDQESLILEDTEDLGRFGDRSLDLFCKKYEEAMEISVDKEKLKKALREGLGRPETTDKDNNGAMPKTLVPPKKPKRTFKRYIPRTASQPMPIIYKTDSACQTENKFVCLREQKNKSQEEKIKEPETREINTLATSPMSNDCHIFGLFFRRRG